jgi:hypothetical protein
MIVTKKHLLFYKNKKLRSTVHTIISSQDTIKIIPAKFDLPLYMVQKTLFKKYFQNKWNYYKNSLENSILLELSLIS